MTTRQKQYNEYRKNRNAYERNFFRVKEIKGDRVRDLYRETPEDRNIGTKTKPRWQYWTKKTRVDNTFRKYGKYRIEKRVYPIVPKLLVYEAGFYYPLREDDGLFFTPQTNNIRRELLKSKWKKFSVQIKVMFEKGHKGEQGYKHRETYSQVLGSVSRNELKWFFSKQYEFNRRMVGNAFHTVARVSEWRTSLLEIIIYKWHESTGEIRTEYREGKKEKNYTTVKVNGYYYYRKARGRKKVRVHVQSYQYKRYFK